MRSATWFVLFLSLTASCAVSLAEEEDPWTGKPRSAVLTLLGTPSKVKSTRDGEVLVYRLFRLQKGAFAPEGMTVLNVPGVGVVGQLPNVAARDGRGVTVGPTEIDEHGRSTGGGVEQSESYGVTWDSDREELERSWEERPAIRSRIKLRFRLDDDGTIESWSVSPKKAAADS